MSLIILFFSYPAILGQYCQIPSGNHKLSLVSRTTEKLPTEKVITGFTIVGNEAFLSIAKTEEWRGNGSTDYPFIIEGYIINVDSGEEERGFEIASTDLFFIFRNNVVLGQADNSSGSLVDLVSVKNGIIANNTIRFGHPGMYLSSVSNVVIENNLVERTYLGNGIDVFGGNNITIKGNTIRDNTQSGIGLTFGSRDVLITDNECYRNGEAGVDLKRVVQDNLVSNNTLYGNKWGVEFLMANANTVVDNLIHNNSLDGVWIFDKAEGSLISGNVISNNSRGLHLKDAADLNITNNRVEWNLKEGLMLNDTKNVRVEGNVFQGNNKDQEYQILDLGIGSVFSQNTITDTLVTSLTDLDETSTNVSGYDFFVVLVGVLVALARKKGI